MQIALVDIWPFNEILLFCYFCSGLKFLDTSSIFHTSSVDIFIPCLFIWLKEIHSQTMSFYVIYGLTTAKDLRYWKSPHFSVVNTWINQTNNSYSQILVYTIIVLYWQKYILSYLNILSFYFYSKILCQSNEMSFLRLIFSGASPI